MKRCLPLLLCLLCLSGCGAAPMEETPPATFPEVIWQTHPETQPTETQQEDSVMEPQSALLTNPQDSDFVRIRDYIPDIQEELIYATADNFTGTVIYSFQEGYLRYGTVKKLAAVQEELRTMGLGLKIWDSFRPVSAQFRLWEIYPDDTYVANPNVGFSNHSRGNAVDLTLVDAAGTPLLMPTEFDDFSGRAARNHPDIPEVPAANAKLLETVMENHGFRGYSGEWWHFNDTDRYEPEHVFDPSVISLWKTTEDCTLLQEAAADSQPLSSLSEGVTVTVMGYSGEYALVTVYGMRGYLPCPDLFPAGSAR